MSGYAAVAVYTLQVPAGDEPTPALGLDEYPATFRITMAAIDPTEKPATDGETNGEVLPRATLKMIRLPSLPGDSDSDDDDDDSLDGYDMAKLLDDVGSDDASDEDDEETSESRVATAAKLKKALAAGADDMEVDAADAEEEDDDEDDEDDEDLLEGAQEVVLCTLDPSKIYQQTLDITINENEQVFFQVSGTHSVHLSGNILVPLDEDDEDDEDDSDDEYDLEPGEDELGMLDDDDEEDELDEIDDPRITDVSDEIEPALVPADAVAQKGKNKRAAEDSPVADKAAPNGDAKLTKAQQKAQKKLKNNAGAAVASEDVGVPAAKTDKKVQFAKTLVQGPTNSASPKAAEAAAAKPAEAASAKPADGKAKASLGVKTVQGVSIDDKKLGTGPAAKKGDKVSMRYIGKLDKDKKVFDSNKKGAPFTFKLGAGEVIKGWDIGVAGMSAGGERRITIPANLAYGSKSQRDIPANSTLVFDVKLLEIK